MHCFGKGEGKQHLNQFSSLPITSGLLSTNASFEKKANPHSAVSRVKAEHPHSANVHKFDGSSHKHPFSSSSAVSPDQLRSKVRHHQQMKSNAEMHRARIQMRNTVGADLTQTRNFDRSHLANVMNLGVLDEQNKVFYNTSGLQLKNSLSN